MAYYKYKRFLEPREDVAFDDIHAVGDVAPLSGLYRCEACGTSTVRYSGEPLPGPEKHPAHDQDAPILWRLIVMAHLK